MKKAIETNNGLNGGLLKGKAHYDSNGNSLGGIKAIVTDQGGKPIEVEGNEVIINKKSVQSEKVLTLKGTPKEILSTLNQLDGNGVAIGDEEAEILAKYKAGGSIANMTKSELKAFYDSPQGRKLDAETYKEWKRLVNMSKSELEKFYNSDEGKQAGLKQSQANKQGIDSGRESARWIMKMKDIPYTEWSSDMWRWAKKQISFIKRMSGMKGGLYNDKGEKTRKHTALLIWGHNPEEKFVEGGELISGVEIPKEIDELFKEKYKLDHYSNLYGTILNSFPKNELGLTTESDRATKEYKDVKQKYDLAKRKSDNFNTSKEGKELIKFQSKIRDRMSRMEISKHYRDLAKELSKGTSHEMEHLETLKKVAEGKLTPEQGVVETAKTHIKENPEYYEDLAQMEKENKEIDKLEAVKPFLGKGQYQVVKSYLDSYKEVIDDLYSTITTMPKTYETDGIPKLQKIAYLHYFSSSSDWYILEKDIEEEQLQAFGFTILNGDTEMAELGYIDIEELKQYVELDFYFEPKTLSEIIEPKTLSEIISEEVEEEKELIPEIKTDIKSYKNPYEINKAIERLVDRKNDTYSANELEFISYYSGYGGLEKFGEIGIERMKGLMYEFYTPDAVVKKMWALAYKYGYGTIGDNSVFEPSVGIGAFLKYAPKDVRLVANEINEYSAKICEILYPNAKVELKYFEQNFLKSNSSIKNKTENLDKYSLIIGNPPYGKLDSKYIGMGEGSYSKAGNFTEYFITRGLDLLVQGGLLIYIVGAEQYNGGSLFLDSELSKVKEIIFDKADLLDAYRLPINIFERTGVSSEIVVFKKR